MFASEMFTPLIVAYLLGSIPFGVLFAKLKGEDLRVIGSGNIGTTNVWRTGSKPLALLTLLGDGLKGALPVWCFYEVDPLWLITAAIIGHVFPLWLSFKGGKGVATALGGLLAAYPLVGLMVAVVWSIIAYYRRLASLATLVAFASSPCWAFFFYNSSVAIYCFILWGFLLWTHQDNLRRLWYRKEFLS